MNLTSMQVSIEGVMMQVSTRRVLSTSVGLLDLLNSSYRTAKYNTVSTFTYQGTRTRCFLRWRIQTIRKWGGGWVGHPDPEIRGLVLK